MEKRLLTGCDNLHDKHIVGYEIHTLDKMIKRAIDTLTEKKDLPRMQNWIISLLYDNPSEDIYQKDIEAQFRIPRSTVTGILQSMEKEGFLIRESVPGDARLKRLVLTKKGIAHKLSIMKSMDHIEQMLKTDIPAEKLNTFFEVVHLMERNIENSKI